MLKTLKYIYIYIFIGFFIILITFPYINSITHIIKNVSLNGVSIAKEKQTYSIRGYLEGQYQHKYEDWYLENFPYRNLFIKGYNQLRYNLFNKGTAIIGKDKYIFEKLYIDEYLGIDYEVSTEKLGDTINDLETINDICKKNGKEFYIIITPSKAEFFSEYIPDRYYYTASQNKDYVRYYDLLSEKLKDSNIKYMDSLQYLLENKMDEPIFYKTGIHYSDVAATRILSSFIKQINDTSELKLRNFEVAGIESSSTPYFERDTDVYALLNIYKGKKDEKYYKPIIQFKDTNIEVNKKLFLQGGSFCFSLIDYLKKDIFQEIEFSFYQQYIRRYDNNGKIIGQDETILNNNMSREQLDSVLEDKDIIILEVNQEHINQWVDGFPKILRQYLEEYGFPD